MSKILWGGEHLTEKQRRRLRKLSVKVTRITDADRRFFERFPHRQHRVRVASPFEIEQLELINGVKTIWRTKLNDGDCAYIAVKNIWQGGRMRIPFACAEGLDCDMPEELARAFYESRENNGERSIVCFEYVPESK
jgi:hypothetical protein